MKYYKQEKLLKLICELENQPISLILAMRNSRKTPYKNVRQIFYYFGIEYKLGTLQELADYFEQKHCTALSGVKTLKGLIDTEKYTKQKIEDYRKIVEKLLNDFNMFSWSSTESEKASICLYNNIPVAFMNDARYRILLDNPKDFPADIDIENKRKFVEKMVIVILKKLVC